MDFWRTVQVLFRRWYVAVPAFAATLALAWATHAHVPVQYESGAVLVLTTPVTGGTETNDPDSPETLTNPLLSFDRGLALSASIVIQQLENAQTARALGVEPGGDTSYEVNNGSSNPELLESGPFVFIVGKGPDPEAAQDITRQVAARASAILDQRQTELGAPPSTHIGVQVVAPPTTGQRLTGSPMRAAAAVGALAGLASLTAVYGFESLMSHRRRRRPTAVADADRPPAPSLTGSST